MLRVDATLVSYKDAVIGQRPIAVSRYCAVPFVEFGGGDCLWYAGREYGARQKLAS